MWDLLEAKGKGGTRQMTTKNRTVYWQVLATVNGKQWPLLIETQLPPTPTKFKEASENVAQWLLSCNMFPWLGRIPLTDMAPPVSVPMPQKDAIYPVDRVPQCPGCQKEMLKSKHQDNPRVASFYCGQRTEQGDYCLWRGSITLPDNIEKVWEIKS